MIGDLISTGGFVSASLSMTCFTCAIVMFRFVGTDSEQHVFGMSLRSAGGGGAKKIFFNIATTSTILTGR